jgi:hypothetical protein
MPNIAYFSSEVLLVQVNIYNDLHTKHAPALLSLFCRNYVYVIVARKNKA